MSTTKRNSARLGRIGIDSRIGVDFHDLQIPLLSEQITTVPNNLTYVHLNLINCLQLATFFEEGYSTKPLERNTDQFAEALLNVGAAINYIDQAEKIERTISKNTNASERNIANREIASCYFNAANHLAQALPHMEVDSAEKVLPKIAGFSKLALKHASISGSRYESELTSLFSSLSKETEIPLPTRAALLELGQLLEEKLRTSIPKGKILSPDDLTTHSEISESILTCKHAIAYSQVAEKTRMAAEGALAANSRTQYMFAEAVTYYTTVSEDLLQLLENSSGRASQLILSELAAVTKYAAICMEKAGTAYTFQKSIPTSEEPIHREAIQIPKIRRLLEDNIKEELHAASNDPVNESVVAAKDALLAFNHAVAYFNEAEIREKKLQTLTNKAISEKEELIEQAKSRAKQIHKSAEDEVANLANSVDDIVYEMRAQAKSNYDTTIKKYQFASARVLDLETSSAQDQLDFAEATCLKVLELAQTKSTKIMEKAASDSALLLKNAETRGDDLISSSKTDAALSPLRYDIQNLYLQAYDHLKTFCDQLDANANPDIASLAFDLTAHCGNSAFVNDLTKPYAELISFYEKSIEYSELILTYANPNTTTRYEEIDKHTINDLTNRLITSTFDAARLCEYALSSIPYKPESEEFIANYNKQIMLYATARKYLETQEKTNYVHILLIQNNQNAGEIFEKLGDNTSAYVRYSASKKACLDLISAKDEETDQYYINLLSTLNRKLASLKKYKPNATK